MSQHTDSQKRAITEAEARAFILSLKPEQVLQVYSGHQGCMCGCRGSYSVNPAHKAEADADRGYEKPAARDLKQIAKILRILQADLRVRLLDGYIISIPAEVLEQGERKRALFVRKAHAYGGAQ